MPVREKTSKKGRNSPLNFRQRPCKASITVVISIAIVTVALIAGIVALSHKRQSLVGTWVYDEYTQYVFEKDGNGCLEVDDTHYEYTYRISKNTLILDFSEDIVRDCAYRFSIHKNELTLIGGENTDGGTYQRTKK